MKDYMVTVMARDRVGIVRDVSTALDSIGGNITNVSQTVMRAYFTLIVSVQMPDERTQLEIRQAVERNGGVGEFEVNVRPYEEPEESVSGQSGIRNQQAVASDCLLIAVQDNLKSPFETSTGYCKC